jgi:hypothetical protein
MTSPKAGRTLVELAAPACSRWTYRPTLSAYFLVEDPLPPRDGIEESADTVYLPAGVPETALVALQSIVDGWVMNKGDP